MGKCQNKHCSPISNSSCSDLGSRGDTLKLHDIFHYPRCKCQKQINFTPRQFQFESDGIRNANENIVEETENRWKNFI